MNTLLDTMLQSYDTSTIYAKKNAMKEVMQEIVLCGLSRVGFFKKTAFYGGTALRIFYGLDRFSEDLDFSLLERDAYFDMSVYFPALEKEIAAYGLHVRIEVKEKTQISQIQSAFLKGNTKEHFLLFYPRETDEQRIQHNETIKIKLEVDTDPPDYAGFERKYRLRPMPYEVNLYDEPSLFAGKIHAVLGRSWKNRVKGRDLYDYVFYLSGNAGVNMRHLRARLIQSGHLTAHEVLTIDTLKERLCERFGQIDFARAKEDVLPFIKEPEMLRLWGEEFFCGITNSLNPADEK